MRSGRKGRCQWAKIPKAFGCKSANIVEKGKTVTKKREDEKQVIFKPT